MFHEKLHNGIMVFAQINGKWIIRNTHRLLGYRIRTAFTQLPTLLPYISVCKVRHAQPTRTACSSWTKGQKGGKAQRQKIERYLDIRTAYRMMHWHRLWESG